MPAPNTVLVGFAEALAAPEVFFSLLDAGFDIHPFMRTGASPCWPDRLPVQPAIVLPRPEDDFEGALATIRAAAARIGPGAVLALDDASLLLVGRAFGDRSGPKLASAGGEQLAVALDKSRQVPLAKAAGFALPPTTIANRRGEITAHQIFPAILKPALAAELRENRAGRATAHYLMTRSDLERLPPDERLSYPMLIQPLIHGQGEGVFGFAARDGVFAWSAHRRIRMMNPHGSGASACRIQPVAPELRAAAEQMMTEIGWRGPFMIELLRDSHGTPFFMELNGRLWGSLALTRRAGFEYPAWAVAQALDPGFRPPEITPKDPGIVRHLGRDLLHLLFVLRGPKTAFHKEHWPRLPAAMASVFRPARGRQFYNWSHDHPRFFLTDAFRSVAEFVRRKR